MMPGCDNPEKRRIDDQLLRIRARIRLAAMSDPRTPPLDPPARLLCGPGPTNISERALAGMNRRLLGHLDPDLLDILQGLVGLLRDCWRGHDAGLTLALQATGTAGMETGIASLLEPGELAIVAVCGFFGRRIVEIARRHRAEVVEVAADWGEHVSNERLLGELDRHPNARLLAVVHAETSTGVRHPLAELGREMRERETLLMADCVTSLGGEELEFDAWGIDYAYSCTQKCLGAPPGLSPIAVSERALERIRTRRTPVGFTFDLELLARYWVTRPSTYHHTVPVLQLYALYEALREALDEGLQRRWERHEDTGRFFQDEIESRGLELLSEREHRLAQLSAVRVPDGVDGAVVQRRLLREHGIEIGGGLGPTAPPIWRIGLMGPNATREVARRVLGAFDAVLPRGVTSGASPG
jgi:alanine-glyoxylate transaminase/serine-glyoxylate transaminase/serine-pyruvate transaminase